MTAQSQIPEVWGAEEVIEDPEDDDSTAGGVYFLVAGPDAHDQALRLVELAAAEGIAVNINPIELAVSAEEAFTHLYEIDRRKAEAELAASDL